jgi:hypothetical protein
MRPESTPELIERARLLVIEKPSTSYIQRKLMIGYNHAAELMEHFESEGIISTPNRAGKRDVLSETATRAMSESDRLHANYTAAKKAYDAAERAFIMARAAFVQAERARGAEWKRLVEAAEPLPAEVRKRVAAEQFGAPAVME